MSARHRRRDRQIAMAPFERVFNVDPSPKIDRLRKEISDPIELELAIAELRSYYEEIWKNDRYQVLVRRDVAVGKDWPSMIHLSIKRLDRGVIHDWRDLQTIKNELVGANHEAVELYPADSRLVDQANQYHLWVLAESGIRFPFGFPQREVGSTADAARQGARQRASIA